MPARSIVTRASTFFLIMRGGCRDKHGHATLFNQSISKCTFSGIFERWFLVEDAIRPVNKNVQLLMD